MLEGIRGYMMDRVLIKYRMLGKNADVLCPRIRKLVEKEFAKCEVKMGADGYIVDLLGYTCTCGYRELSGFPCCHAISAITQCKINKRARGKRVAPQDDGNAQGPKRGSHCSKCGSPTHNARTCPLNRANGIHDVRLNVADRRTIERELCVATAGVGVYVNERTGNQAVEENVVELRGSQPPPSQP
ncbi:unnamed protein product [Linum trigynum]|uniref:SWIM-type domain-containing protein n=1 Tax=Linum trigynum TaxID=586398 RepID=A0AAV2E800_9ROSI